MAPHLPFSTQSATVESISLIAPRRLTLFNMFGATPICRPMISPRAPTKLTASRRLHPSVSLTFHLSSHLLVRPSA